VALVDHNAAQIRTYLAVLSPLIDKGAPVLEQNFDDNAKGPRGAISDRLHEVIEENARDLEQLRRLENELRSTALESGGYGFGALLLELQSSPGCTRSWPEEKMHAFRQMSYVMAYALRVRDREHRLNLIIGKRDREMRREERLQAAREDAGHTKRLGTRHALEIIGRCILDLRRERGCTLDEAIEAYREWRRESGLDDKSRSRCIEAWNLVKHDYEDGAA
jgi:hypothetical protein